MLRWHVSFQNIDFLFFCFVKKGRPAYGCIILCIHLNLSTLLSFWCLVFCRFWLRVMGRLKKTLSNHRNIDFTTRTYYKNFYYTRQYCLLKVRFVYQQISFPLRIFLDTIYSANFPSFPAISTIVNRITSMGLIDLSRASIKVDWQRITIDRHYNHLLGSLFLIVCWLP